MPELPNKALLRPDEVAVYLSISKSLIYSEISCGNLEAEKYRGAIRIPREAVLAYREVHKVKPLE